VSRARNSLRHFPSVTCNSIQHVVCQSVWILLNETLWDLLYSFLLLISVAKHWKSKSLEENIGKIWSYVLGREEYKIAADTVQCKYHQRHRLMQISPQILISANITTDTGHCKYHHRYCSVQILPQLLVSAIITTDPGQCKYHHSYWSV